MTPAQNPDLDALRAVPWLGSLDAAALARAARQARRVTFPPGETVIAELETGDELYVVVAGRAQVSVASGATERRELYVLGPGDVCGETALLTRALRSATVTAVTEVVALRFERPAIEDLVARHPAIAVHFTRVLSARLAESDAALDELVGPGTEGTAGTAGSAREPAAVERLVGRSAALVHATPTLTRAWRELVVGHQRDRPFLALMAFVATLAAVRVGARAFELSGAALFGFLRAAYTGGIALVFASTATSLARFRGSVQRVVAVVFGVGFALILNELSVFLAFDTFYLDMTTRDPAMVFNVETLYRRSESQWGVAIMLALLVQLAFLRSFYRRTFFVVLSRASALLRRGA